MWISLYAGSESEPISVSESMELIDHEKTSDKQHVDQAPVDANISQTVVDDGVDKDQKQIDEIQSNADELNSEPKGDIEKKNEWEIIMKC